MTKTFGIGAWRTRDGRKAVVTKVASGGEGPFPLVGRIDHVGGPQSWNIDGSFGYSQKSEAYDLVAPWIEERPVQDAESNSSEIPSSSNPQPLPFRQHAAIAVIRGIYGLMNVKEVREDAVKQAVKNDRQFSEQIAALVRTHTDAIVTELEKQPAPHGDER